MTETEAAYMAELFDGDGCVCFGFYKASRNGRRYGRLLVNVSQNSREVLDWMVETLGYGHVYRQQSAESTVGRAKRLTKDMWQLKLLCGQARRFLKCIRPHLHIKAQEVDRKVALDQTFVHGRHPAG